jgi:hypothetical protein
LEAVTGRRAFYYSEIRHLKAAENIAAAYQSRQAATDWVAWARENPYHARILAEAEELYAISDRR